MGDYTWAYKGVVLLVAAATLTMAGGGYGTTTSYFSDTEGVVGSFDAATGPSASDLTFDPHSINLDNNGSGKFHAEVSVRDAGNAELVTVTLTVEATGETISPVTEPSCSGSCRIKFSRADLRNATDGPGRYDVTLTLTWASGFTSTATGKLTIKDTDKGRNAGTKSEEPGNETTTTTTTTDSTTTTTTDSTTTTTTDSTTTTTTDSTTTTTTTTDSTTTTTTTTDSTTTTTDDAAGARSAPSNAERPVGASTRGGGST